MHTLESRWITLRKNAWGEDLWEIQLLVNGRDFIQIIREYELSIGVGADLAGAYSGISLNVIPDQRNSQKLWLGEYPEDNYWSEKTILLGCASCSILDCWPLLAKVELKGDMAIWSHFEQPHRSSESSEIWDYSDFGPFVFEVDAYTETVNQVFNALRVMAI